MSELLEDISNPISDSEPSGEDIAKLDSSVENQDWILKYTELRGLVRKVSSNSEGVVDISQSILANKSKDLRIASNLCLGLLHQNGFAGFAEGLKGYHILLEQYWDKGLYPLNESARARNVSILDKNMSEIIRARRPDKQFFIPTAPTDGEALEDIKETAGQIKSVLSEKSPDRSLSMDNIVRAVDERLKQPGIIKKQAEVEEKPAAKPKGLLRRREPAPTGEAQEEVEAAPVKEESADTGFGSDLDAVKAVIRSARFLLEKSIRSIFPYRLLRSIFWFLFVPPNPDKDGKRVASIAVPPDKSGLEQLLKNEDWEALVMACEASFIQELERGGTSFCLDVQRFLCTALKELIEKSVKNGDENQRTAYQSLHKVILQETAMLVDRFPFIPEMLYSNGVPFADNQTKKWIEESVKPVFASAGQGSGAKQTAADDSSESASQISEDLKKAEELLARQKWEEALSFMQTGINSEPACKGRFQRRLGLANLCLDANQPIMARPLFEDLDAEVERFSLDQWEPGLCLQVWTGLKRCYQELLSQDGQQENNGFYREKVSGVFEKICRLDIRAALTSNS